MIALDSKKKGIILGCVADDFTGASDAASFLAVRGLKTVLCNGIPADTEKLGDCDAVVIALKTRSVSAAEAVQSTRGAFGKLKELSAQQFYLKYCSTFDSTPRGNIGPTTDCAMEDFGVRYTLLCPSLPVNKRTVRDGCLYVDDLPLHQSHMKNHPLNPMWASDIGELMKPQGKYPCLVLDKEAMRGTSEEIHALVEQFARGREHFYVVPEYVTGGDGEKIARVFGDLPFLTGGSGLLEHLADRILRQQTRGNGRQANSGTQGRGILLCGSCSKATLEQIQAYKAGGGKYLAIEASQLRSGAQSVEKLWNYIQQNPDDAVLAYSTGAENASRIHDENPYREQEAALLEKTMAALGRMAYDAGFTRIIVAGGETSGAVTLALNLGAYYIGESVAPGVPVMTPVDPPGLRIVLKSGNFGQADFFRRALDMTGSR